MHARRDGKGRKATSTAETRRDTTRKDDEGRRGSRTAALNAVPSDRQHRLLRGSSARSGSSSLYARSSTATLTPPPLLSVPLLSFSHTHIFSLAIGVARPRQPRRRRRKSRAAAGGKRVQRTSPRVCRRPRVSRAGISENVCERPARRSARSLAALRVRRRPSSRDRREEAPFP